ncbi:carboxymuconolactone decarboxylase family protein [Collimonas silvisoli]|uniref:carboxymuconolactone decarboxylase family protein n=1 Tax=Collimonas silvisoli TaxID=2825884 RepID=UPI001E64E367|nr:carboxymuconolactone decarboxylase family protein [Collimonas silvisoli]
MKNRVISLFHTANMMVCGLSVEAYAQAATPVAVTEISASKQPTRAQQLMGDIAPKMAELTDDVLFGDVWQRPQLSKRDRSLVTVSALVAMNRPDQLRAHLALARENGLSEEELIEAITHLAFYSGWPNAVTAISVAREVFKKPPAEDKKGIP